MYLQCKMGFVEADRWDGTPIVELIHAGELRSAFKRSKDALSHEGVIVVRSRVRSTLVELTHLLDSVDHKVLRSPPEWDYKWRVYLTMDEWAEVMNKIALGLDYRNFKSWTHEKSPGQSALAHAIWRDAEKYS